MSLEFELREEFNVAPEVLYHAWLDSETHSAMTGSPARVGSAVGDRFEAWDGYIEGKNLELVPSQRVLQAWRTAEFSRDEPDSLLEVRFEATDSGSRLVLRHSQLPPHGMQYKQGWIDSYFTPMKEYFAEEGE